MFSKHKTKDNRVPVAEKQKTLDKIKDEYGHQNYLRLSEYGDQNNLRLNMD